MPDQLASCLLGNTYTYTRTVITRSVDGVTRHTRHRLTGCKDDRLPTFLILACDTIWETQTHTTRPAPDHIAQPLLPPLPPSHRSSVKKKTLPAPREHKEAWRVLLCDLASTDRLADVSRQSTLRVGAGPGGVGGRGGFLRPGPQSQYERAATGLPRCGAIQVSGGWRVACMSPCIAAKQRAGTRREVQKRQAVGCGSV